MAKATDGRVTLVPRPDVAYYSSRLTAASRLVAPLYLARGDPAAPSFPVRYEYRAAQADLQVKCQYCKRTFKSDQKLAFHNRWFCGPNARRSAAQAKTQSNRRQYDDGGSDDDDDDDDSWHGSDSEDDKRLKKGGKVASASKGAGKQPLKAASKAAGKEAAKAKAAKEAAKEAAKKPASKGKEPNGKKGKEAAGGKKGTGKGKAAAKGRRKPTDSDVSDDNDDDDGGGGGGGGGGVHPDEEEDGNEDAAPQLNARALAAQRKARAAAAVAAKSVLHRVAWQRIVLDEAHSIKDKNCSTARAAFALHAAFRWCLSGTPLQNRVGELYSLVQFVRLDPYCFYFCKTDGCDCKCREYHFDAEYRKCMYCGCSPLKHYSLFNQSVVNPIKKFGYVGAGKNAFVTLKVSPSLLTLPCPLLLALPCPLLLTLPYPLLLNLPCLRHAPEGGARLNPPPAHQGGARRRDGAAAKGGHHRGLPARREGERLLRRALHAGAGRRPRSMAPRSPAGLMARSPMA